MSSDDKLEQAIRRFVEKDDSDTFRRLGSIYMSIQTLLH